MVDFTTEEIFQQVSDFGGMRWDVTHPNFAGGAKMDGETDDGPAFRAALAWARDHGGGIVGAGPRGRGGLGLGVAKISGTLPIGSLTLLDIRNILLVRASVEGEGLITNEVGAINPAVLGGEIDGLKATFADALNRGIFWRTCTTPKVLGTVVRNTYAEAFRADHEVADFLFDHTECYDIGTDYLAGNPDGNGYFIRSFSSGIEITEALAGAENVVAAKLFGLKNPRPIWTGVYTLPESQYETWTLEKQGTGEWTVTGSVNGAAADAAENVAYDNGFIAFKLVPQPGAAYVTGDQIFIEVGPDGTGTNLGKSPNTTYGQLIKPKAANCAVSSFVSYNAGNQKSVLDTPEFKDALGARHINIAAQSIGWKILNPDGRNAHSSAMNITRSRKVQVIGGALVGVEVDGSGIGQYGQCISIGPDVEDISIDGTETALAATDGVIVLPGARNVHIKVHSHDNGQNLLASDGVTPVRTGIHAGADGIRLQAGDGGYGYLPEGDVVGVTIGDGTRCEFNGEGSGIRAYSDNAGANQVKELKMGVAHLDDNASYGYDFDEHTETVELGNFTPLRNTLGEHSVAMSASVTRSARQAFNPTTGLWESSTTPVPQKYWDPETYGAVADDFDIESIDALEEAVTACPAGKWLRMNGVYKIGRPHLVNKAINCEGGGAAKTGWWADFPAFARWPGPNWDSTTTAAVASATPTTLVYGAGGWTPNQFQHRTVSIVAGTGAGQSRYIASNDDDTLTLSADHPWGVTPDATSTFYIDFCGIGQSAVMVGALSLGQTKMVGTTWRDLGVYGKDDLSIATGHWTNYGLGLYNPIDCNFWDFLAFPGSFGSGIVTLGANRVRASFGANGNFTPDVTGRPADAGGWRGAFHLIADYTLAPFLWPTASAIPNNANEFEYSLSAGPGGVLQQPQYPYSDSGNNRFSGLIQGIVPPAVPTGTLGEGYDLVILNSSRPHIEDLHTETSGAGNLGTLIDGCSDINIESSTFARNVAAYGLAAVLTIQNTSRGDAHGNTVSAYHASGNTDFTLSTTRNRVDNTV